jgi:2-pyrone-4,6-dicarboxylate lactonase
VNAMLRVSLPPDPNPRPPRFVPPPGACDTHFHVFGPPHLFPYVDPRRYTPPAAPVEHFFGMAAKLGLARGVMVQPQVHRWDNASTLDAIAKGEGRLRGMIHANPNLTEADYRALHAGGVRGVRFNFNEHAGGAVDLDRFRLVVSRMEPVGWPIDLHIGSVFLLRHADLIRRASLPVVIDHFANVRSCEGEDRATFEVLHDLAGEPHVWVKVSGADRLMSRGGRYEDIVRLARALIARAPDRIIWGTDWPHSNIFAHGTVPNDGDLLNMLLDYAPDEAVRRKILADNPARLFGFA